MGGRADGRREDPSRRPQLAGAAPGRTLVALRHDCNEHGGLMDAEPRLARRPEACFGRCGAKTLFRPRARCSSRQDDIRPSLDLFGDDERHECRARAAAAEDLPISPMSIVCPPSWLTVSSGAMRVVQRACGHDHRHEQHQAAARLNELLRLSSHPDLRTSATALFYFCPRSRDAHLDLPG